MSNMVWWQWAGLAALAALPIACTLLALGGINILLILAVLASWLMWPAVGPALYTATWVNLVLYRVIQLKANGGRLGIAFPMSVANQNGASSLLAILGIVGAIRSAFAGDWVGMVLGVIGGAVLLLLQWPIFRHVPLPPLPGDSKEPVPVPEPIPKAQEPTYGIGIAAEPEQLMVCNACGASTAAPSVPEGQEFVVIRSFCSCGNTSQTGGFSVRRRDSTPTDQARFRQDIQSSIAKGQATDYTTVEALLDAHREELPTDVIERVCETLAQRWQFVYIWEGVYAYSGLVHVDSWRVPEGPMVCRVVVAPRMPPGQWRRTVAARS